MPDRTELINKLIAVADAKLSQAAPTEAAESAGVKIVPPAKQLPALPSAFPAQSGATAEERSLQSLEYVAGQSLLSGEKMICLGRSQTKLPASTFFMVPVALGMILISARDPVTWVIATIITVVLATAAVIRARMAKDNLGVNFILTNQRILEVEREDIRWKIKGEIPLSQISLLQPANQGRGIFLKVKGRVKLLPTDNADKIIALMKEVHPQLLAVEMMIRAQTTVVLVFAFILMFVGLAVAITFSRF